MRALPFAGLLLLALPALAQTPPSTAPTDSQVLAAAEAELREALAGLPLSDENRRYIIACTLSEMAQPSCSEDRVLALLLQAESLALDAPVDAPPPTFDFEPRDPSGPIATLPENPSAGGHTITSSGHGVHVVQAAGHGIFVESVGDDVIRATDASGDVFAVSPSGRVTARGGVNAAYVEARRTATAGTFTTTGAQPTLRVHSTQGASLISGYDGEAATAEALRFNVRRNGDVTTSGTLRAGGQVANGNGAMLPIGYMTVQVEERNGWPEIVSATGTAGMAVVRNGASEVESVYALSMPGGGRFDPLKHVIVVTPVSASQDTWARLSAYTLFYVAGSRPIPTRPRGSTTFSSGFTVSAATVDGQPSFASFSVVVYEVPQP